MYRTALINCTDYELHQVSEGLKRGINLIGGWEKFINPGEKVFVKLNLLMKKRPEEAVTTHPTVVEAVVRQLKDLGAEVTIGDSPGGPFTTRVLKGIYKATGIEDVAEKTGANLNWDISESVVGFSQGKIIKSFTLCSAMKNADKIVSLSKLKTHQMTRFTGAVKVLFGAIPGLQKAEYHLKMPRTEDFCDMLIDLALCVNPVLNIMDGIIGMEGHGPSAGTPRFAGSLLVSTSPFALDWVATERIGLKPQSIPTIVRAIDREIYTGPKADDLLGDKLVSLKPPFKAPEISGEVNFPLPKFITDFLRPKPIFSSELCIGCGECAKHCPPKAIKIDNKLPDVDMEACIRCFCCQELCPQKAVKVKRSLLGRILSR